MVLSSLNEFHGFTGGWGFAKKEPDRGTSSFAPSPYFVEVIE